MDIECPEESQIEMTMWNAATTALLCTYTIDEQTGREGAYLRNTTEGDDIDLEGSFENFHVEKHGLCLFGGTQTSSEARLDIDVTIQGHDEVGEPTGVTIIDAPGC